MTGRADSRPAVLMAKFPDEAFTYSLSLSGVIADGQTVDKLAISTAPSGDDELTLDGLSCDGANAVVKISAGQPGRIYSLKCAATMNNGEVREVRATLTVSRVLLTDQPAVADSDDFGQPTLWPADPARSG